MASNNPDTSFQLGLIQMNCASPEPEKNLSKAVERIGEAARLGANVVCLPELFRTPYLCQHEDTDLFDLAEPIPGPTTQCLGEVAREHGVAIVAPIFERRTSGIYHNSLAMLDSDGTLLGVYRKMHIPDDPLYYEKFYFTPGDGGFCAFDTEFGRIGTLICWDQWFPEAARLTALRGAAILVYPTAIGWHPAEKDEFGDEQRDAWRTVQRGHAIANGVYVAAVNRVGHERARSAEGIEFWGSSFICDPQGVVIAEAPEDRESIVLGRIDPERIEQVRRNWPFWRDRRIDAYGEINRRFLDEQ